MSVRLCYKRLVGTPAAAFLSKFYSSVDSYLGVGGHRPDKINVGVSHFRKLKWETLTQRLCRLSELKYCSAGGQQTCSRSRTFAHDGQLMSSQMYVMVVRVR